MKWRFLHRIGGDENGLDTSDVETFKKDPNASLAREIAQNSIDAAKGDEAVIIEFKLFEVERSLVPGIDELTNEIELTVNYVHEDSKDRKPLENIRQAVKKRL